MNLELWLMNLWFYSLQVAILVFLGGSLIWALKIRAPHVAHNCWRFLLAGCLALPLLQPWKEAPVGLVDFTTGPITAAANAASQTATVPWAALLAVALIFGMAVRLVWMAVGLIKLQAYREAGTPAVEIPCGIEELNDRMGVRARLFLSTIAGPVTWGYLDPVILLPDAFARMPVFTQRLVLCHEFLHIKRRDWLLHMVEELLRAFFWFHPAVLWLIGRIRLTREQVVDREVIRFTSARRPYLDSLYQMAATRVSASQAPAPLFLEEAELTRRVALIVKEVRMSKKRTVLSVAAIALVLFVGAGWAVSAFPLTREAAGEPQPDKTTVTLSGDTASASLLHKVQPTYPPEAKKAGVQGTVHLTVKIDKTGQVSEVTETKGDPVLAKAAVAAVKQWRYKPVLLEEKPVEALTTVTVNFVLKDKDAKALDETVNLPEGATPPKVVDRVEPAYPAEAKEKGIQGQVVVKTRISEAGVVTSAEVISGPELLRQAAIDAIKQWRFEPALKDGKPIAVNVDIAMNFKLK